MTTGDIALLLWFIMAVLGGLGLAGLFIAYWLTKPTSYRDLEP